MMKLYASTASPFARKIRIMLIEKNIPHDVEMISLYEPNTLQSINPIGKVPALQLDDGRLLINSSVIAEAIDDLFPSPRFIPNDINARIDSKRWEAMVDGILDVVISNLYEIRFHEVEARSAKLITRNEDKIQKGLQHLEENLGSKPWISGNALSIADVSIACMIGFFKIRTPQYFPAEQYPHLADLWNKMEQRESFKATIPTLT